MIAIVDYGVGNLFSLTSSLSAVGAECIVTGDPDEIKRADRIILPGVGAFGDAIKMLTEKGLDKVIFEEVKKGKKLLGICLGMQMLFESSLEGGMYKGLSLIEGSVMPMATYIPKGLKIPHIGWNRLSIKREHPLLKYIKDGDYVYFVHSYYAQRCEESIIADCDYGIPITAAVCKDNVAGTQFHPEKSGEVGLNILRAFVEW